MPVPDCLGHPFLPVPISVCTGAVLKLYCETNCSSRDFSEGQPGVFVSGHSLLLQSVGMGIPSAPSHTGSTSILLSALLMAAHPVVLIITSLKTEEHCSCRE